MFLDDELNEIAKEGFSKETAIKLIKACCARLPKPDDVQGYINALKRTDASWRLFCTKHSEYKKDGFRNYILNCCIDNDDSREKFKKVLRW